MKLKGGCGGFKKLALALAAALALFHGALSPAGAGAADRVGGDFALERVDLRFVGGERVKVLSTGQSARAEAEITFTGTGQLGGAWEIAEPSSTAGAPQYRTLELVSRLLGTGRREVLASPPLPTAVTGAYLLRLTITHPSAAAKPPALRYFVGRSGGAPAGDKARSAEPIAARGPVARQPNAAVKFSWLPVPGSVAYQLELFERDATASAPAAGEDDRESCLVALPSSLGRPPVTGMMVPGTLTEIALSRAAERKLTTGKTYLWRVVALDGDGTFLCDSPLKELVW